MKTVNALPAAAVALTIALLSPLAPRNAETSAVAIGSERAFQISRPSDVAASCNALVAEIDQLSTEMRLWSAAQPTAAPSTGAKRRLLHLTVLLKQRSCAPSQTIALINTSVERQSEAG